MDGVSGFLLPRGLAEVLAFLRDACAMRHRRCIFCDIGCGDARVLLAAAEASPSIGGCVGFDLDRPTLMGARRNLERFRALRWSGSRYEMTEEGDPVPPIALHELDVTELANLGCSTHAYVFCYGMPPGVIQHVLRACRDTPALRYLVLVHRRGDLVSDLFSDTKAAGGEVHEFVDPLTRRSRLRMPGQVVHGGCVRIDGRMRRLLDAYTAGTELAAASGSSELETNFVFAKRLEKRSRPNRSQLSGLRAHVDTGARTRREWRDVALARARL